jgi:hypothetical protein
VAQKLPFAVDGRFHQTLQIGVDPINASTLRARQPIAEPGGRGSESADASGHVKPLPRRRPNGTTGKTDGCRSRACGDTTLATARSALRAFARLEPREQVLVTGRREHRRPLLTVKPIRSTAYGPFGLFAASLVPPRTQTPQPLTGDGRWSDVPQQRRPFGLGTLALALWAVVVVLALTLVVAAAH